MTPPNSREIRPLRKIVEVVRFGLDAGDANLVLLECGHEVRTEATYRARCRHCAKALGEVS